MIGASEILVFDVGGTNIRLAIAKNGKLGEVIKLPSDSSGSGFAKFLGVVEEVARGRQLKAVAGGLPGQFRGEGGEFLVATNLPGWAGIPIMRRLKELFDCPIGIANDVEMAALGEAHYGAGTTEGVMAYYTVSTGVNGAKIVNGKLDTTLRRNELGKQIVAAKGRTPVALEPLISGSSLEKRFGMKPRDIPDKSIWTEVEHTLAWGIYNTRLFWDPCVIVFGGSMMRDISPEKVGLAMAELPPVFDDMPKLVRGKLGDTAGLLGAIAWTKQKR